MEKMTRNQFAVFLLILTIVFNIIVKVFSEGSSKFKNSASINYVQHNDSILQMQINSKADKDWSEKELSKKADISEMNAILSGIDKNMAETNSRLKNIETYLINRSK